MTKAEQINLEKRTRAIGNIFLMAIGINQYDLTEDNLQNCCTDANKVFDTIKTKDYFPMNDNSILITSDKESTQKQHILDRIKACEEYIDEHTNIIFYFSGHGCNINDVFHFIVSDSIPPSANLISIDEITDILTQMNKGTYKSITILIDACQTKIKHNKGLENRSRNFINEYIDNAKGIGIIYSCSKGEFSQNEFNKEQVSVFTSLLLQALNGHTNAVDANYLTFNKLFEYLQLESRMISKAYYQIEQHPQLFFQGNDIVYAYIPDEQLTNEKIKISIQTYDDLFTSALSHLQHAAAMAYWDWGLHIENDDDVFLDIPSERFIRQACEELSRMGLLDYCEYPNILSLAFAYFSLMQLESADALQPFNKLQIIDDVNSLCDTLYDIHGRFFD